MTEVAAAKAMLTFTLTAFLSIVGAAKAGPLTVAISNRGCGAPCGCAAQIRRDVGNAITVLVSRCVRVRETVSMVRLGWSAISWQHRQALPREIFDDVVCVSMAQLQYRFDVLATPAKPESENSDMVLESSGSAQSGRDSEATADRGRADFILEIND